MKNLLNELTNIDINTVDLINAFNTLDKIGAIIDDQNFFYVDNIKTCNYDVSISLINVCDNIYNNIVYCNKAANILCANFTKQFFDPNYEAGKNSETLTEMCICCSLSI